MIKLPREVSNIIKKLETEGFETYTVGGCVRDSLIGMTPVDWDLATAARLEDLTRIFPEAKVISEKFSVIRFDYTEDIIDEEGKVTGIEGIIVDVATYRLDGQYTNHRRPDEVTFIDNIQEDLKRRDFTINAMADNAERGFIDLYEGREDIKKKIIKTIGDPVERFQEDPIRMMRAIRFAAELGFDLHKSVFDAILGNWRLLENVSVDRIRGELERILVATYAGKGLNMMASSGIMAAVVGEEVSKKMNSREMMNFTTLCENIDKTKQVRTRRLGLLYTCFDKKRGLQAIDRLNYDSETYALLYEAMTEMINIQFLYEAKDFKRFLVEHGIEKYNYLHNLSKAQRIIYNQHVTKIESRNHMMNEIIKNREPVFIEDLAIDGNDILEAGIAHGEKVGELLLMLTDVVHKEPKLNTRKDLLEKAKKFSKSKLAASARRVKWMK
ncbi:MAG: hypothetical protein RR313_08950 [Anaerovoracaceae bacterium]